MFLLAIWFIAGSAIVFSRWFFTTQFPKHLSQYEAMLGEATGIDVKAGRLQTGFTLLRPVITLEDVALSRRSGPVSLHLPKVQAELAWSSIWHLEPRFQTLIISAPTFNVRRLNEKTYDIGGFTLDIGGAAEPAPSGEASRKTDIPALKWLLSQGRILIKNGTFRYTDETLPEPLPVAVNRANIAFEQRLFDYRASLSGILQTDGIARPFDLRARLERTSSRRRLIPSPGRVRLMRTLRASTSRALCSASASQMSCAQDRGPRARGSASIPAASRGSSPTSTFPGFALRLHRSSKTQPLGSFGPHRIL